MTTFNVSNPLLGQLQVEAESYEQAKQKAVEAWCRVGIAGIAKSKLAIQRKPARDPIVVATEKAYRASNQYQIDKLLKLEKRYAGRLKLAEAGLAKTRRQIRSLLTELAKERLAERAQ